MTTLCARGDYYSVEALREDAGPPTGGTSAGFIRTSAKLLDSLQEDAVQTFYFTIGDYIDRYRRHRLPRILDTNPLQCKYCGGGLALIARASSLYTLDPHYTHTTSLDYALNPMAPY